MKYTTADKADARVIESSPAPLPFPGRLDSLPEMPGVVILTDDLDEVVYVVGMVPSAPSPNVPPTTPPAHRPAGCGGSGPRT